MTQDKTIKQVIFACALACFAGTAFAGVKEISRDANRGDESAQKQLAARYASGNEVVKDDVLSEQWLLRADKTMSAQSCGNALEVLQEKWAEKPDGKPAVAAPKLTFKEGKSVVKKNIPEKSEKVKRRFPAESETVSEEPEVQIDDFQRLLRAASQGNRLALQRFQTDAAMRNRLVNYARTAEGKRNPFVTETIRRLKK